MPLNSLFQQSFSGSLSGFEEIFEFTYCWDAHQDAEGFIWIGSTEGLVRFDGLNLKYFRNDPNDPGSIASDNVISIAEDAAGNFWLSLPGEGMDMYDVKTNEFIHFREQMESEGILLNTIRLYCDSQNKVWIGNQGGDIAYYDIAAKRFSSFSERLQDLRKIATPLIAADFEEDNEGNIWIALYSRLARYERATDSLTFFEGPSSSPYMVQIEIDSMGKLWVGDKLNGIFSFDPEKNEWRPYGPYFNNVPVPERERIDFFDLDDKDHLRAIHMNGIYLFLSLDESSDIQLKELPLQGSVWLKDREGNQFIFGPKVYKKDVYSQPFNNLFSGGDEVYWANGMINYGDKYIINAILERPLIICNQSSKDSINIDELIPEISHLTPKIIYEDSQGNWWIGDFSPGKTEHPHQLYKFNPRNRKLQRISGRRWSSIGSIVEDKDGIIWVGHWGGLVKIHQDTGIIAYYNHDPGDPNSISSNAIRKLMIDSKGMMWIATGSGGLNLFNPETGIFRSWSYDRENLSSISSNYPFDIYEDSNGKMWVGTHNGLNLLLPDSSGFERLLIGIIQDLGGIGSIEEDDHGYLWLGCGTSILRLHPETKDYQVYDQPGGIYSHKDKNGYLYFGATYFHPDSIFSIVTSPTIYFNRLKVNNNEIYAGDSTGLLKEDIRFTESITLHNNENFISIGYSSLYHYNPESVNYQYQLLGFDNGWQRSESSEVSYTHLPSGKYIFLVRAANIDGKWSPEKPLIINIMPPWWKTWWAYLLYGIMAVTIANYFYRRLKRRWELEAQLALEHSESEKLKELNQLKSNLYTNITHEFRTPLTVILGMADQIKEQPREWVEKGTKLIKRNGQNLLRLVNQMLDLSKLEAGMVSVHLIQGDLVVYLKYLLESFQSLAQKRNISLEFRSIHNSIILDFDPEKIREICSNLISNAIKYNKDGGDVLLDAEIINQDNSSNKSVRITVRDNGKGIPEDVLPSIFDRFTRGHVGPSGAGIGLALTKELVKLLGGKIDVESTLGKGSRFTITLPVFNNAPMTDKPFEEIRELGYDALDQDDPVVEGSMISKVQAATQTLPMLLLVEDSNDVVIYMRAQLKSNYKVIVAGNGYEGWGKAIELVPDIIVSDVMMPEMDGLELLQRLKSDLRTSHIPVILLTAKADIESRLSGLERGADAYLTKPFHKPELEVRLRNLIESRRRLHERYRHVQFTTSESPDLKIEDAFIMKINEILHAQISNEFYSISDLCRDVSMSRTQLYRKFTALTGQSIGHYIKLLRINRAKELLTSAHLNITEVAYQTGFKDPAYFSRVFKEITGKSPKHFRE